MIEPQHILRTQPVSSASRSTASPRVQAAHPTSHTPAQAAVDSAAAPHHAAPTLAPEVLLAAQEARDPRRARVFDPQDEQLGNPGPQPDPGRARPATSQTESAPTGPALDEIVRAEHGGQVVELLLPQPRRTTGSSTAQDQPKPTSEAEASPHRATASDFDRARQAYVGAGADDGRVFATAQPGETFYSGSRRTVDLIA